jgi:hypothetical protein
MIRELRGFGLIRWGIGGLAPSRARRRRRPPRFLINRSGRETPGELLHQTRRSLDSDLSLEQGGKQAFFFGQKIYPGPAVRRELQVRFPHMAGQDRNLLVFDNRRAGQCFLPGKSEMVGGVQPFGLSPLENQGQAF